MAKMLDEIRAGMLDCRRRDDIITLTNCILCTLYECID